MKTNHNSHPLFIALGTFASTIPARPAAARQRTVSLLQALPRLLRAPFLVPATTLGLAAIACVAVGLILSFLAPTIIGAGLAVVAGYLLLRTRPAVCENRLNQADEEWRAASAQYATECRRRADEFAAALAQKVSEFASSRVAAGAKVAEVRTEFKELEKSAREHATSVASRLATARETAQRADKRFRELRSTQSTLSRRSAATLQRRSLLRGARQILDAMVAAQDAELDRVALDAELQVASAFADAIAAYARDTAEAPAAPVPTERVAEAWRGLALPLSDEIREEAIARAGAHVSALREAVVTGKSTDYVAAVDRIVDSERIWPLSVGEYFSKLNGGLSALAERLVKNSSQWLLARPKPGRRLHRKAFLFAADGANSPLTQALHMRLPTAGITTLNHPASEALLVLEERLLTLSDVDEASSCLAAFRAAPEQVQRDIVTAVDDPHEIIDSHADRGEASEKASRLLAASLVLGFIERSGAQEYRRSGRKIAKGYTAAIIVVRTDLRVAAELELALASAVARDGSAAVIAQLKAAADAPGKHAPKDALNEFRSGIAEAVDDLERRAA